jgi:TonB family protein
MGVKFFVYLFISLAFHFALYELMATSSQEKDSHITVIEIGTNSLPPGKINLPAARPQRVSTNKTDKAEKLPGKEGTSSASAAPAENGSGSGSQVVQSPQVLKEAIAKYPKAAKMAGIEGVVEMQVTINTQGLVESAELIRGPGYGLNEAALEAMKNFIFSPALRSGEKVSAKILYRYRFILGGS